MPARMPALESPDYRLLFYETVLGAAARWALLLGRGWLVFELTGSTGAVGIVTFAGMAPFLFLGPIGGGLADRLDRRRMANRGGRDRRRHLGRAGRAGRDGRRRDVAGRAAGGAAGDVDGDGRARARGADAQSGAARASAERDHAGRSGAARVAGRGAAGGRGRAGDAGPGLRVLPSRPGCWPWPSCRCGGFAGGPRRPHRHNHRRGRSGGTWRTAWATRGGTGGCD